jgi:hypothetical protein
MNLVIKNVPLVTKLIVVLMPELVVVSESNVDMEIIETQILHVELVKISILRNAALTKRHVTTKELSVYQERNCQLEQLVIIVYTMVINVAQKQHVITNELLVLQEENV